MQCHAAAGKNEADLCVGKWHNLQDRQTDRHTDAVQ